MGSRLTGSSAAGIVLLSFTLVGCSTGPSVEGSVTDSTAFVTVSEPRFADGAPDCAELPAVAEGMMSADLPASSLSYFIDDGATTTDVDELISCLEGALTAGRISVD